MPTLGRFLFPIFCILSLSPGRYRPFSYPSCCRRKPAQIKLEGRKASVLLPPFRCCSLSSSLDWLCRSPTCGWHGFFPVSAPPLWRRRAAWFILFFPQSFFLRLPAFLPLY